MFLLIGEENWYLWACYQERMQILPDKYKSFQQSELEVKWSRWKSWSWAASQGCLSQGTVCLTCQAQQGSLWVIVDLERKPVLPGKVICRCLISSCSCRTLKVYSSIFFWDVQKNLLQTSNFFFFFLILETQHLVHLLLLRLVPVVGIMLSFHS